jgi:hypothetical protein
MEDEEKRRMKLLDCLKEKGGFWKLKEETQVQLVH